MSLVVFDMGGSSVKYALWDDKLIGQSNFKTPTSWDDMKASMLEVVNKFKEENDITGIAISSPGSVDVEAGIVYGISAIPYIHNFEIQKELEEHLGYPVSLENDANSAALAEMWLGKAKDVKNALFVVIGTGIGGAVIQDGKLVKGNSLFAGEFGIMMLDETTSFSRGATAVNMTTRYTERLNLEKDAITGKEIFDLADQKDPIAMEEVDTMYRNLSLGIYNLMFTTDPELIILGGGISRNEKIIPNIEKRINKRLKDFEIEGYKYSITACEFLDDANLVGAVYAHKLKYGGL